MRALFLSTLFVIGCHHTLNAHECAESDEACGGASPADDAVADSLIADSADDSIATDSAVETADTCECKPGEVAAVTGTCPGVLEKKTKTCTTSCSWGAETCALPKGWTAIADSPIEGRVQNSAIWTGGELLVYGGGTTIDGGPGMKDGAIYSLVKNTWTSIPSPSFSTAARKRHAAMFDGRDMLVWGGLDGSTVLADGMAYDTLTKTWSSMSTSSLAARERVASVWIPTLRKWFMWGGDNGSTALGDGALFEPSTATWTPLPTAPISNRFEAVTVWTGTEVLVWGGFEWGGVAPIDGALFNPATNTWRRLPDAPIKGRVFAGYGVSSMEFVVRGGNNADGATPDGAVLNLSAPMTWRTLSKPPGPQRGMEQTIVGGGAVFAWSGFVPSGGEPVFDTTGYALDLKTDVWSPMPTKDAPPGRGQANAIWTGSVALIWSGYAKPGGIIELTSTGAIYVP